MNVEFFKVFDDAVKKYEKVAKANEMEIIIPPVEFHVSAFPQKLKSRFHIRNIQIAVRKKSSGFILKRLDSLLFT